MQTTLSRCAAAALLLALPLSAQLTHVIPNGFATAEGSTSNAFPWGSSSTNWPGLHTTTLYDSTNFTNAQINMPILITRLRWRANGGVTSAGGTFSTALVQMSTAAVDAMAVINAFGPNFGPDLTTVYNGAVTVQAAAAATPGPWVVDVALTNPFVYDPNLGDLVIDVDINNANGVSWSGLSSPQLDVDGSTSTLASRVWGSLNYPGTNGSALNHGVICEVTYMPSGGNYATWLRYGAGCPTAASAAVYEQFSAQGFDLAYQSLLFVPIGGGSYTIVPGANVWYAGFSNNLALGNDQTVPVTLPFAFPAGTGSVTTISVCSNGFIWLGSNTATTATPTAGDLVTNAMGRIAACWMDLNPPGGGGVYADYYAGSGEYVVTWNNVPEASTNPPVSMQIALQSSGMFELRFLNMTNTAHAALTGYSAGGGSVIPTGSNLSSVVSAPIFSPAAATPLVLAASARPTLGTSINLLTSAIPAGTSLGANYLSFRSHNPGLDLTPFGAPGCAQYTNPLGAAVFLGTGSSATRALGIPNLPGLAGLHVYSQSVSITPGINALGLAFTNGIDLGLDVN